MKNFKSAKNKKLFQSLMGNHFEDVKTVDSNLNFNAICISETSQRERSMFCNNIDL